MATVRNGRARAISKSVAKAAGTLRITDGGEVSGFNNQIGGTVFTSTRHRHRRSFRQRPGINSDSEFNTHVGYVGTGTLTIENGGNVTDANGFIATFSGSTGTATVTGAGSTWTNTDSMNIGSSGDGTLIVEDGGTVTNTDGHIGSSPGSMGSVTVRGAGSNWNMTGDLFLGAQGTGNLTIEKRRQRLEQ